MTGAGLPPIVLEAVRKILAISQDSAHCKKTAKPVAKPTFRLEMTPPVAPMAAPRRVMNNRTVNHGMTRRRPGNLPPDSSRASAEGAESC